MAILYSCECQDYNSYIFNCIHIMFVYYVKPLYIYILFEKCQKYVKIIYIKNRK